MFSSPSQWRSFKLALCCSSGLIMALYSLILVNLIYKDNSTDRYSAISTKLQQETNCQSSSFQSSTNSQNIGSITNKISPQVSNVFDATSLNLQDCLTGVIPLENRSSKQEIIVSPKTFPELWKAATNASETVAKPFPNIHESARAAKVPIFMYHDILPQKEVFFDVTPQELEAHF